MFSPSYLSLLADNLLAGSLPANGLVLSEFLFKSTGRWFTGYLDIRPVKKSILSRSYRYYRKSTGYSSG